MNQIYCVIVPMVLKPLDEIHEDHMDWDCIHIKINSFNITPCTLTYDIQGLFNTEAFWPPSKGPL